MLATDILSPATAATAAIAIFLSIVYYFLKNRDILPGPRGWPYFGLFFKLNDETCHLQLEDIGKKYGDFYSFTFMGKLVINLGSIKALREVHVNKSDCFGGRFTDFNMLTYILEEGVAMSNGEQWRNLRKYFVQVFKEYGLTVMKDQTSGPLYDTLEQTVEDFRVRKGEVFNVIDLLVTRCMVTMRKTLFGDDGVTDAAILRMNEAYAVSIDGMIGVKLLYMGPVGRLLFNISPSLRRALAEHKVMTSLLYETIKKIESSMDENNPTCVVEDYFRERNSRRRKNDPSWKYFSDKALVSTLAQIVGDGILSVGYFIGCFLNALVEHPEEQDKIYNELMEVIGPNRLPTVEDKSKMAYTTAFMNEVIRTSSFFPLFPSMECTKETTIRGYRIPQGSITLLNIWQCNHDPQTYENPHVFNPSRFLTSPGKPRAELPVMFGAAEKYTRRSVADWNPTKIQTARECLPWYDSKTLNIAPQALAIIKRKRACTGEPYVMTQAFLFLTSLVKNFTISELPNQTKNGLFLMTGNLQLRLEQRTEK